VHAFFLLLRLCLEFGEKRMIRPHDSPH
jgi:hypothetical protein